MTLHRFLGCVTGTFMREAEQRADDAKRRFARDLDDRVADGLEEIARLIRQERCSATTSPGSPPASR
jgi:hypothetical protein